MQALNATRGGAGASKDPWKNFCPPLKNVSDII